MILRRYKGIGCALMVLALLAPPARAADVDAETRAREQYVLGNKLYDSGKMAEAEAAYEEAWKLRPSYDVAGNLSQAELGQGKTLEALEHLRYALDNAPVGGSKKKRAAMQATYDKALAAIALLQVTIEPSDVQVVVDGLPSVLLPEGLAVEPGERLVRASKPGFVAAEARVSAKAGERQEVKLTLAQEKVEPAAVPTATAPGAPIMPPPTTPQDSNWPDKTVVLWAGGGTAAALGIAGVVLTVLANGKASDEDEARATLATSGTSPRCTQTAGEPAECAQLRDAIDAKDSLSNGALWTLVGAGAVGLATAGYWLWAPEPEATAGIKATPFVGRQQAGLWIEGSFE